ncbi:MAG: hypothetical protein UF068_00555, partial [Slackia isoflavoniconvertens]|nr:hypothetical protein [Slackia isoflavoniconvertens]
MKGQQKAAQKHGERPKSTARGHGNDKLAPKSAKTALASEAKATRTSVREPKAEPEMRRRGRLQRRAVASFVRTTQLLQIHVLHHLLQLFHIGH